MVAKEKENDHETSKSKVAQLLEFCILQICTQFLMFIGTTDCLNTRLLFQDGAGNCKKAYNYL